METKSPLRVKYDKKKNRAFTLENTPDQIKIDSEMNEYWEDGKIYIEGIDFVIDQDHLCSKHAYLLSDEHCDGYECLVPTQKTTEAIAMFKRFREKKALFEEININISQILLDKNDSSFGTTEIVEFLKKNYDISHKKS